MNGVSTGRSTKYITTGDYTILKSKLYAIQSLRACNAIRGEKSFNTTQVLVKLESLIDVFMFKVLITCVLVKIWRCELLFLNKCGNYFSKKLLFTENGEHHRKQLYTMQRANHGEPSSTDTFTSQLLHLWLREHH